MIFPLGCARSWCVSRHNRIATAARQKERFDSCRREILEQLHRLLAPVLSCHSPSARMPPSQPEKRPPPSPLARSRSLLLRRRRLLTTTQVLNTPLLQRLVWTSVKICVGFPRRTAVAETCQTLCGGFHLQRISHLPSEAIIWRCPICYRSE